MSDYMKNIWLVGAGPMAAAHADVLTAQKQDFAVIGRGEESAARFSAEKGVSVVRGGVDKLLAETDFRPQYAIVATNMESLAPTALSLINGGVKNILIEKPAGLDTAQIISVAQAAKKNGCKAYVAYNRRFFSSVILAKKLIAEDGGVTSFNFEFTEWAHTIDKMNKPPIILKSWFLANPTHIIDLAFYLAGSEAAQMSSYIGTDDGWYGHSAIYSGAGITEKGVLFSYQANWRGPGRWGVEMITKNRRFIFRPIEKLQVQPLGSVKIEFAEQDDRLDTEFKPGLYLQMQAFLSGKTDEMITIESHARRASFYDKIANP